MISAARQSHRPEAFAVLSLKIRPPKARDSISLWRPKGNREAPYNVNGTWY